jgi:ribosomal protein L32
MHPSTQKRIFFRGNTMNCPDCREGNLEVKLHLLICTDCGYYEENEVKL